MSQKRRAHDWLNQAINDLSWAKQGVESGYYSQVCFLCQQSAEKAIKAIAYYKEYEVRGHSIVMIAKKLGVNSSVLEAGRELDIYYISSRYPDALPEGAPYEIFSENQAQKAVRNAQSIIDRAVDELNG